MTNFNLSTHLSKAFIALNQKIGKTISYPLTGNIIKLSKFQYEVLFLIVLGKSVTEISETMTKLENIQFSRNGIRWIIDHLYLIFEVHSTDELIEKATITQSITNLPPILTV